MTFINLAPPLGSTTSPPQLGPRTKPRRRRYDASASLFEWQLTPFVPTAQPLTTSQHIYYHTNTALPMLAPAAQLPLTASMKAASVSSRFAGMTHVLQLMLAFILGGLFFSTVLSFITASVAIGDENMRRGWKVFKAVSGTVWDAFTYGLQTTRDTLIASRLADAPSEDDPKRKKWCWREAWKVLKQQLALTKKAAADGVEAIKLEASMYSSVIGAPGLILTQTIVNTLTPKLFSNLAKENFANALADVRNPNIKRITLEDFTPFQKTPTLTAARTYNLDDAIGLDLDVEWKSRIKATIKVTPNIGFTLPITIRNIGFDGVVRVVLTPLTEEPPGFGAILVSFPKAPNISLDISLSKMELTKSPWLREELLKEIQKAVADQFLWPRRIIIPSMLPPVNLRPILSREVLNALMESDPLLDAERKMDENEVLRKCHLSLAEESELGLDVLVADDIG